jgi:hypothetical protein
MTSNILYISSICDQRRKQQLYPIVPSRTEIVSPYTNTNYTKFDLDMRRKAEILKYDQGNTKTNKFTKKQLWAQLVNNPNTITKSYITRNTMLDTLATKVITCDNKAIQTPSSSSNVPNDYINNVNTLYVDENVPLYNYINPIQTRSYGIINNATINTPVLLYPQTNVNSYSKKIAAIEFTEAAKNNYYTVNLLNIPLALQINGDLSGSIVRISGIPIQIAYVGLTVIYNSSTVNPTNQYSILFDSITNFTVDISAATTNNNSFFSGTQFIGSINITNIVLEASPGFVYDIYLNMNIINPTTNYSQILTFNSNLILNTTTDYLLSNTPFHCSIKPNISLEKYGVFTVTAT